MNLATDNGRLIARITGAVARAETERKSARMIRANQQAAERGVMRGRTKAFGYTPEGHLDPHKAPAVRHAYDAVLAGRSLRAIAEQWNAAGFTTQTGKPWERSAVRKVLLNPRNAGLRARNGVIVTDAAGNRQAAWPALVDRDTFDAVTALLSNPTRRIVKTPGRKYLMSGIALCGKCSQPLGSTTPSKQRGPRYHCKHCFGVTRKIEDVDNYVLSVIAERLSRPDAARLTEHHDSPDLAGLRERANALHVLQQGLMDDVVDGKITRAQLHTANERISAELAGIDAKLMQFSISYGCSASPCIGGTSFVRRSPPASAPRP